MHTHSDTLKILNCSKMTLSRYVANGDLKKVKKGRRAFYDEHEVAALVSKIEKNKNKVGIEIKPKVRIELPEEVNNAIKETSSRDILTPVGYEYLSTATNDLINLGLYEDCDKQTLVMYAISCQNFFKYLCSADENDCVITSDSGITTIHPHFKVAQHHEKQMIAYMDRLGLNPLSRQKFEIKEKEKKSTMMDILND